jgi:hypothetical protein
MITDEDLVFVTKYPLRLRDCEHYDECLETAAFENRPKFDCDGCRKYTQKDIP